ncbi:MULTISPECIES: nucleotidyltransferase family protein [Clostridium]|uniref:Molybdopterin-guanine dinucleotide biosynthesis protein A n=1 Tax=Clostridium haemolyticum NCTC 9693 TaxID=1443114 RepID=A0ABR4TBK1_CLOHA|nr:MULTISPECIES: nucleotidyltransferase family protein [Clostridium]KEI14453.1 molybdopterin-guanine dinucleotide biosynthesis protein A [Clostridium haemolyticum NCTC 9693]KGM98748.1 molybdopterin-guanine dinucleotide biosynthesis protein A [Clostridium haemolyticum NCTC 8350]MCD3217279.1 nucleotidyltransferase family protein [Clostridium botulinum C]MCD3246021.1 nucleotidyltransferase family protein [Clostridium botulinum C]MCD3262519.1 nucleotidyltransferase family protein [Clostridium botu
MAVEGIILAAGLSSRAKTYKMTLKVGEKTVIENVIDNMLSVCSKIFVVGGYKIEKLEPIINKYKNVQLVFNENFMEGMFSSVKKGFSCIKEESFFFTPGDYPLIDKEVYRELIKKQGEIVIPTYKGRKGHPILMKSHLINEVLEENNYSNLREFIGSKSPVFLPVHNQGILLDIDTINDYNHVLQVNSRKIRGV